MKAGSAGLDAHAGHIFISHVEENADVALAIANGLEEAGYTTWCYERDALPGPSYLLQTSRQIEGAAAVVVVISGVSLGSHQVTAEVIRAHESGRPFVPVLVDISHVEFAARQPEWREALGSSTSVMVPAEGVAAIIPRICDGLRGLGITPSAERPARAAVTYTLPPATKPVPAAQASAGGLRRRWPVLAAVGAALVVVAALVLVLTSGGGDQGGEQAGSRQETSTTAAGAVETTAPAAETTVAPTAPPATAPPATSAPASGGRPPATSAPATSPPTTAPPATQPPPATTAPTYRSADTTPVATAVGSMDVLDAWLTAEWCSPEGDCLTASGSDRYLVLDLIPSEGDVATVNDAFRSQAAQSTIRFGSGAQVGLQRVSFDPDMNMIEVVYGMVSPAAYGEALLQWPSNDPLRLTVS